MAGPLSIRLEGELRRDLESEARARGSALSQLVRDLLEDGVRAVRKERIRQDSLRVATYAAASPDAQALFDEAGGDHFSVR